MSDVRLSYDRAVPCLPNRRGTSASACLLQWRPTRHVEAEKMTRLTQSCRRFTLAAGALSFTLTLPAGALRAQGPGLFDAFAARKQSTSDPVFAGLSFGGYAGILGLRVGGALNFNGGNGADAGNANNYGQY